MAAAIASVSASSCTLGSVEIGQYDAGESGDLDPTSGTLGTSWTEEDLREGVSDVYTLWAHDLEVVSETSAPHRLELRIRTLDDEPVSDALDIQLHDTDGNTLAGEGVNGVWQFDGVVEPGWWLLLVARSTVNVELVAHIEDP